MKRKSVFIAAVLCLSLAGCSTENEKVESAESVIETEETSTETIEEEISVSIEEIDLENSLDITDIVVDIMENYDDYKEIALKHGMIYTDGTKTDGPVMMEEITPYEPGEAVTEYDVVGVKPKHKLVEIYAEDYETIYDELKDMTEEELHEFIVHDCLDTFWEEDEYAQDYLDEGMSYLEVGRLVNSERFKVYAGLTVEEWAALSIEEQRDTVAKMAMQWGKNYNVERRELNKETEKELEELASYGRKVPKNAGDDYEAWYKSNEREIIIISNIDFTVGKVLPDYITEEDGRYYVSQEDLRDLYESQGSPEDKNLEMEFYGYHFSYDINNLYPDW